MTTRPDPDEIRRATFRVAFRGYDQAQVAARLEELAESVARLLEERDRLTSRLGELADRDLKSEFETLGREVASVLEAARTAAETLRDRAGADAARWRSEATAEAERLLKAARTDAEAMRTDAWTTGSQLLDQVQQDVERQRETAQRDSLSVRGEAEREAHRLTSAARREAEDVVRNAKMESERLVAQARSEHDEIISRAHRQAEAAQQRTRALEERRRELMDELEQVRATLSSFEETLEERRQGIGLTEPAELPRRAVVSDEQGTRVEDWEEGHTVRVIRPSRPDEGSEDDDSADAETLAAEVARMRHEAEGDEPAAEEQIDAPDGESLGEEAGGEVVPAAEPEPDEAEGAVEEPVPSDDNEVSELFRRLRAPQPAGPEPAVPEEEGGGGQEDREPVAPEPPPAEPERGGDSPDVFETRERLLLPVTNDALRSVKRALTEAQNHALEQLRLTNGEWAPDATALEDALDEELEALVDGASEAGLEAATEMGIKVGGSFHAEVPGSPFGVELARAVSAALEAAGPDARDRSGAASRVFRGWRTDEAERRIRHMAFTAYHGALSWALESQGTAWRWVAAGRLCSTCRAAAEAGDAVPPAHRDCSCTIVPA